jgi:hypothetical protein
VSQPLVLAIEPDLRQAAIVKRIVREKGLADVIVVDSLDAAIEAMRTSMPDVLLVSALLSPRDEDELMAHLKTLDNAGHLQTHTIPQLASALGAGEERASRGLLSAFRRKKEATLVGGCDPELFADEIRVYLQQAADKKQHVRTTPFLAPSRRAESSSVNPAQPAAAETEEAGAPESSWSSPFEWKPATTSSRPKRAREEKPAHKPAPAPEPVAAAAPVIESAAPAAPEPAEPIIVQPAFVPAAEPARETLIVAEPAVAESVLIAPPVEPPREREPLVAPALEVKPVVEPIRERAEPAIEVVERPVEAPAVKPARRAAASVEADSELATPAAASRKTAKPVEAPRPKAVADRPAKLTGVQLKDLVRARAMDDMSRGGLGPLARWARSDAPRAVKTAAVTSDDVRALISDLAVPAAVASVTYPRGVRIRRVRVPVSPEHEAAQASA